jgi:virginiamycin A acetyltransferase
LRLLFKRLAQAIALLIVWPVALCSGFGRVTPIYILFAHLLALGPGIVGSYCRAAYYRLTLKRCSQDTTIAFGTFFSRQDACVDRNVSIGSYCVIGRASIGEGSQISSHVEIPSGRHDHPRDTEGRFLPGVEGEVHIGSYCFIGASAIVMANVGHRSTIGAGSVVVKDIPDDAIAVGNPARVITARVTT